MTTSEIVGIFESRGYKPRANANGWMALCPGHDDKTPSLSIAEGHDRRTLLKCWAGCTPEAIVGALGLKLRDLFADRPKSTRGQPKPCSPKKPKAAPQEKKPLDLVGLEPGTAEDYDRLAKLRGLPREGIEFAVWLKLLYFGDYEFKGVETSRVWVVTDVSRKVAQVRRLDGENCRWINYKGELEDKKSKTLQGSTASWPVGLAELRSDTPNVLLVEGGPDLLAACCILAQEDRGASIIPVAMLGGSIWINDAALSMLSGCHVRIVPHCDGEPGEESELKWVEQLKSVSARVDVFELSDEISEGKDLNDFCRLTPPDRWKAVWS